MDDQVRDTPCVEGRVRFENMTGRLALVVGVSVLSSLATLLAVGEIQVQFRVRGRGAETAERLSEAPQSMHVLSAVAPNASEYLPRPATFSPRSPPSAPATSERPRQLDHYSWVTTLNKGADREVRLFWNDVDLVEHIDHGFAKSCLAGRSILLIGDSLTRYQYLNLVHYLATGSWTSAHPRNEMEAEHNSWEDFYQTTAQRNLYEVCDCHRRNGAFRKGIAGTIVENRYFSWSNISITYIQYFSEKNGGVKLHDHEWLTAGCRSAANASCQSCAPGSCDQTAGPFIRLGDILGRGVLLQLVQRTKPSDIVLNVGIHDASWLGAHAATLGRISREVQAVVPTHNIRFHWKTTTYPTGRKPLVAAVKKKHPDEQRAAEMLVRDYDWKVFDLWDLTRTLHSTMQPQQKIGSMYSDSFHFRPWVYAHLNGAFLLHMCENIPSAGSRTYLQQQHVRPSPTSNHTDPVT